ncbi:MAG: prolyl oligopeptidase family serine peptidase [Acidimicrobiales bacterium]
MTTTAPYGSWRSPVSSQFLVANVVRLANPSTDGSDTYWVEGRPLEAGREVIVKRSADGTTADVISGEFAARTLAHEYGGLCYVAHKGVVYFTNFGDQRLYRIDLGSPPRAITDEPLSPRGWRYADPIVTPDGLHVICVRESHEETGVVNELIILASDGSALPRVLASGHDFYAAPVLSGDGRRLAWITWDHPCMPWDGTRLHEAVLDESYNVASERIVCGGDHESVVQPRYGVDTVLHYISDRSGWWNLYLDAAAQAKALSPLDAEFALPAWRFGTRSYAVREDGSIVTTWSKDGVSHLGVVPEGGGPIAEVATSWQYFDSPSERDGVVVCAVGSPVTPLSIVEIELSSGQTSVLKASRDDSIDPAYLSVAEPIEFSTEDHLTAHALFYPPTNPDFRGPEGARPALIVESHGGPTSHFFSTLNYDVQYWTSRGFAVVDVNYGGSTGYGRAYRERLKGNWGVVDLDDCVNAAASLISGGRVNENALVIRGGSAGGYTTLCALTFRSVFAAGASYFGVGDLGALARDTHKFESRYLDGIVGPYSEREDLYRARSPIFHTELMSTPMILFQGLEDEVVPPAQAEAMAEALRQRGVPFAYLTFEGEQHGFRQARNIVRAAEAELYFYSQVLGFESADEIDPVIIENLDALAAR